VPRHPDPELEQRILTAASRLWARGGEKALTMRAVASAAETTTPTVYERYRDRADILRALRLKARGELFAALSQTRTLGEAVQGYLQFALNNPHGYEVLFDGVGKPPSLYEPWPSFNLMLIIRGGFAGSLKTQAIHACLDTAELIIKAATRPKAFVRSGPKWPATLVLGEGERSSIGNGFRTRKKPHPRKRAR